MTNAMGKKLTLIPFNANLSFERVDLKNPHLNLDLCTGDDDEEAHIKTLSLWLNPIEHAILPLESPYGRSCTFRIELNHVDSSTTM